MFQFIEVFSKVHQTPHVFRRKVAESASCVLLQQQAQVGHECWKNNLLVSEWIETQSIGIEQKCFLQEAAAAIDDN